MEKIKGVLVSTKTKLKQAGIENYSFEACELVSTIANCSKSDLVIGDKLLGIHTIEKIDQATSRRIIGYPVQYILGEWEFYSLSFYVGEGVLIPRADTEILVETCINLAKNRKLRILDLCSGSGCIAIALKKNLPQCEVFALEKSEKALPYLHKNITLNEVDVTVIEGDVLVSHKELGKFDMIVSNPPYITGADMKTLQKEVTYEPEMALYGEDNGLYFYECITEIWKDSLNNDGILAFEIGRNQYNDVAQIFNDNEYKNICKQLDLCGIIRVIYAIR